MRSVLILLFLYLFVIVHAQKRCAVDSLYFSNSAEKRIIDFEDWMSKKILEKNKIESSIYRNNSIVQLPVVFHVVHRGEPVGTGVNLSDERILQQLQILNEDFRRTNTDQILTPLQFLGVAADTEIEFVLAKQDPEGLPTTGIIRVQGSRNTYTYTSSRTEDRILKSESYWPAEDYLNIYIADLSSFLGWAEWPYTDLEGVAEIADNRLLDGVVVDYQYVGINPTTLGSFQSYGRTLTHEIGHFLGLRHVWGDGGCAQDDFCADTPNQSVTYDGRYDNESLSNACPPAIVPTSCDTPDMYSNYMNYTADYCMNIFSQCQKERMQAVLSSSPRRKSLTTSPALQPAIQSLNDLGVRTISSPTLATCFPFLSPTLEIRNYGTNEINSFTVAFLLNGQSVQVIERNETIEPLASKIISFNQVELDLTTSYVFEFKVVDVNTMKDLNPVNDSKTFHWLPIQDEIVPFYQDFEDNQELLTHSKTENSQWETSLAPNLTDNNIAARFPMTNKENFDGSPDYLLTPVLDLTSVTSASLTFEYAYASVINTFNKDGMQVAISLDCGENFHTNNILWKKYAPSLATSSKVGGPEYSPTGPSDWEKVEINLTPFVGNPDVRIGFGIFNNGGSPLYLDNIKIESDDLLPFDLGISGVQNLPLVICENTLNTTLEVRNYGFEPIPSFEVQLIINEMSYNTSVEIENFISGNVTEIPLSILNIPTGKIEVKFTITTPLGFQDENLVNNSVTYNSYQDESESSFPINEQFFDQSWIPVTPQKSTIWEWKNEDNKAFWIAKGYDAEQLGIEHYLITENYRTGFWDSAGLSFEYAYQSRAGKIDELKVLLSIDCGKTFPTTLAEYSSSELSEINSNFELLPENEFQWQKRFIDLSSYTQFANIRLAFVFTNGGGNNLFIDNVEITNNLNPSLASSLLPLDIFPNPANDQFTVRLNLQSKQDVILRIVDNSGKTVQKIQVFQALNQLVPVDATGLNGVYLVYLEGNENPIFQRVVIGKSK